MESSLIVRTSVTAVFILAAGCAGWNDAHILGTSRTISAPARLFPQLATGAGMVPGDLGINRPVSSECPKITWRDGDRWRTVRIPIRFAEIRGVAVDLPVGYTPLQGSRVGESAFDKEAAQGDRMLGSWIAGTAVPIGGATTERDFTVWISSDSGYPAVGLPPDASQQEMHECQLRLSQGSLHVVLFTVEYPDGGMTHFVGAYANARPGVWMRILGEGPDGDSEAELLRALATMRLQVQ